MKNINFSFDPALHIYRLDKRIIPGVTDIVNSVCGVEHYANEWHLNRGRSVHKAISLYLRGTLDPASIDERIRGQVEAAKKAVRELNLNPPYILEVPMFNSTLLYAGTPDLLVRDILIDWKSSHQDSTEIQIGGYIALAERYYHTVKKGVEIVLNEDGKYSLTEYKPARCKGLFLAALTIFQWKKGAR